MKSYRDHLISTDPTKNALLKKPVFRSSAIFPFIINNKISNKHFVFSFINNKNKNKWLKKVDGEFVIISLSKKDVIEWASVWKQ